MCARDARRGVLKERGRTQRGDSAQRATQTRLTPRRNTSARPATFPPCHSLSSDASASPFPSALYPFAGAYNHDLGDSDSSTTTTSREQLSDGVHRSVETAPADPSIPPPASTTHPTPGRSPVIPRLPPMFCSLSSSHAIHPTSCLLELKHFRTSCIEIASSSCSPARMPSLPTPTCLAPDNTGGVVVITPARRPETLVRFRHSVLHIVGVVVSRELSRRRGAAPRGQVYRLRRFEMQVQFLHGVSYSARDLRSQPTRWRSGLARVSWTDDRPRR